MDKNKQSPCVFPFEPPDNMDSLQEKYRSSVVQEPSMKWVYASIVISMIVIGLAVYFG